MGNQQLRAAGGVTARLLLLTMQKKMKTNKDITLAAGQVLGIGDKEPFGYYLIERVDEDFVWLRNLRRRVVLQYKPEKLAEFTWFVALDPKIVAEALSLLTQARFMITFPFTPTAASVELEARDTPATQ